MAERETSRDIDQAAANWAARLDRGPLTPQETHAFQAWLRGDPRSKGAFLRAQALSMLSESAQALGTSFDPGAFAEPKRFPAASISRRRMLTWAGGAAAAASLVALGISIPAAGAVISTGRGEIRLVPLKDGSTVQLNTQSSVRVHYDEGMRLVSLLHGEAYFTVTPDKNRPFIVEVNGRQLHTAQAGFRVRKFGEDPVDVLVQQGQVTLAVLNPSASASSLALKANTRLIFSGTAAEVPQLIAPEAVTRELAWREGKLAFEGATLKQAALMFARYSDTRIHISDPLLASEPVTGLFSANDPMGFSRAIARVFNATLKHEGNTIILSRNSAGP